ncbi:MAG: nitroreductase family protein, partial [Promethearchaeota archaeon]
MNEKSLGSYVFSVIRYRRSIRNYDSRPIEDWKLELILESARLAPSSTNSQPWRIIVVRNRELKNKLAYFTPRRIRAHEWLKVAPVVLIICASPSKVQRFAQVMGKDYHLVDIGIAGEHIVLVAAELGVGSCWIG